MRITNYKRISDLKPSDLILLDSDTEGTRAITALELSKQLNKVLTNSSSTTMPLPVRRMTYRGKNLGNVYTTKQKEAVANGSFDDLFIGDYWVAPNGHTWIIVDFDSFLGTYINTQKDVISRHHIICISRDGFPAAKLHTASTTDWYKTNLFTTTLQSKIQEIADFFGATNIISHQKNVNTYGDLTQIDCPTLSMLTGTDINNSFDNKIMPYVKQLAYFIICDISDMVSIQLQTPNNTNGFLYINRDGSILLSDDATNANRTYRPFVVIAGE